MSEPRQPGAPVYDATSTSAAVPVDPKHTCSRDVLARRTGGVRRFQVRFRLLRLADRHGNRSHPTALVAAIGAALGFGLDGTVDEAVDTAADNPALVAIISAIVLGLVLFIAYFAGGYVAGRMARFSGMKQGLAVWIWAVGDRHRRRHRHRIRGQSMGHPRQPQQFPPHPRDT